ncbi:MAG: outer membrane beta-barrel protein [Gammaproteobacteria bacterium]|nr:outer membrane beta-barrel protein [Gammaproteobacteria bacterium]
MKNKKICTAIVSGPSALLLVAGVAASAGVFAADDDQGGIEVGPGYLYPTLTIEEIYDDNIFDQDGSEKGSLITKITPELRYELEGEYQRYSLSGGVSKGIFHSSRDDSYLDGKALAEAFFTPTDRITYGVDFGYVEGHEDRGSGDSEGNATLFKSPDEYHEWSSNLHFVYGLDEIYAPQIRLLAGYNDREFDNNRTRTVGSDVETTTLRGGFTFRIAPHTALELEASSVGSDYNGTGSDRTGYAVLAGLSWEATYQTTGFLKVGASKVNFDSSAREDTSWEPSWLVGVNWEPLEYSSFTFSTARDITGGVTGEPDSDVSEDTEFTASWRYEWTDYILSTVSYSRLEEEYWQSTRDDTTHTYAFDVAYAMRDWLTLGAGYSHEEKDSNAANLDYKDNIYYVNVKIGL